MHTSKKKLTSEPTHNGLAINTNQEKQQACHIPVLDKYHTHLNDMTDKHSKVLQVRFDLHYPQDGSVIPTTLTSKHLSDFNYNLQRKLHRENHAGGHKVDPRIITVTEKHHSSHPHVHGVLLVNGNAKQNPYPLLQEIEKQWKQAIGTDQQGLVDYCDKNGQNGIIINRNSDDFKDKKQQVSYQGSYLAKTRDKEHNPKGSWLVKGTRLPKQSK